jgi:hypothetical protein
MTRTIYIATKAEAGRGTNSPPVAAPNATVILVDGSLDSLAAQPRDRATQTARVVGRSHRLAEMVGPDA